jgi:hypothetical protein
MKNLRALSDDQLIEDLDRLIGSRNRLTARMLAYLIEVEDRRLHLRRAYSSMRDFCINQLGMHEGEAQRHLVAARLGQEFPLVLELVETGKAHLSGLALLRAYLTEDNHAELLGEAAGKTTRAIEALLAARFPKPDAPDAIRKLPQGAQPALGLDAAASSPSPMMRPPAQAPGGRNGRVEPLSATTYKIQFTASQQLVDKIEHAKNLLSHANPSGELSDVMERAVDLLIADLERKKLGKTNRPRRSRPAKRGAVTRAARRQVVTRDGLRCAWVDDKTGRRCEARAFLEFDHMTPKARGGSGEPDEVRVLCRAHNRLYAEQVYGRELVEQKMHLRYR